MTKILRIVLFILLILSSISVSYAYDNVIYIWQRNWDKNLDDAISIIQQKTGYFTVLCGDLKFEGKRPTVSLVDIKWPYLTQTETSATLAFRINAQASKFFATDAIYSIADSIKDAIGSIIKSAPQDEIVGVQFDYDCPTSKLKDYARFVKIMRERLQPFKDKLSEFNISITALPTWLQNNDFKELIETTDYYVLQLHSFELPKDADQARKIFPADKAQSYTEEASNLKHPYYISLPTYGYEVAFTKKGDFIGLRAENMPVSWSQDVEHKVVMTDPKDMLTFIQGIEKTKPKNLLGFYWFRIPLKSDEFNWDIKTLECVLSGKKPSVNLKLDLVNSKDGLCEVYLVNSGEQNIFDDVNFNISWQGGDQPLYDLMGKFHEVKIEKGIKISGPAPYVGQKVLVGWFRSFDKTKGINLKIGEVNSDENI